jgi:hypothetical protein
MRRKRQGNEKARSVVRRYENIDERRTNQQGWEVDKESRGSEQCGSAWPRGSAAPQGQEKEKDLARARGQVPRASLMAPVLGADRNERTPGGGQEVVGSKRGLRKLLRPCREDRQMNKSRCMYLAR